jgi:hypothetical protein
MISTYQYSYLIGNLLLLVPWLVLFAWRKDLRHKILIMSFIIGLFGPLSQLFYLRDYWHPQLFNGWRIGIEDFLFGFFIGGISCTIYEELFGLKYTSRHIKGHKEWMISFFGLGILILFVGNLILGFNSIYVSIFIFIIFGITVIRLRHDLLRDAIISGVLVAMVMFTVYLIFIPMFPGIVQSWWKLNNISGILVFNIPLEELLWACAWGFVAGPFYEFLNGLRFKLMPQSAR